MADFTKLPSYHTLQTLVSGAIDFSEKGELTPKRIESMVIEACGFNYYYGTERVDREVEEALCSLARESGAIDKMVAMQSGEVVNTIIGHKSEDRRVLHTAMRDHFEEKNPSEAAVDASADAFAELEKLKSFLVKIEASGTFTDIVQIGIGGSDLGPRAIYYALEAFRKPGRRAHFISNVDPDDAISVLQGLDLQKTLIVIVSKSGTTLETLTNEQLAKEILMQHDLIPKDHMVAITGKGSPMDDPSKYLESFYIWDHVGGRYAATSMIGCVTLGFTLGMGKLWEFLKGANKMDKVALLEDPKENLPLMMALIGIWNRNFLNHPTLAVLPYSQGLSRFPAHLQQLDMESNGKHIDRLGNPVDFHTGPIIWGEPGTNGQHSFYQSLHQGTDIASIEFIGFKKSQRGEDTVFDGTTSQEKLLANLMAQSIAFAVGQDNDNPNKVFHGNRPNSMLIADQLTPFTVGALLSLYENKVAFQGFIWNINSFDQEGVQLGKVLANRVLKFFEDKRDGQESDAKQFPLGHALFRHIHQDEQ